LGRMGSPVRTASPKKGLAFLVVIVPFLGVYRLLERAGNPASPKKAWPFCLLLFHLGVYRL
jgi:hypothetical protein